MFKVAIITISDTCSSYIKEDKSGKVIEDIVINNNYEVVYKNIINDDKDNIKNELIKCSDEIQVDLILTTGGTGLSNRDNTREATIKIIEKEVPGITEYIRYEGMKIKKTACLSRACCGIRNKTLILNLPGSSNAVKENLMCVIDILEHALKILKGEVVMCGEQEATIIDVCISEKKGTQKKAVDMISLIENYGIEGDAHAANWHRQVSLLSKTSVKKVQDKIDFKLKSGAFAENILIDEGIVLYELPIGTKLKIGTAMCIVTQIGKECHNDCAIRKLAGDCVMPREGIFVKVLENGVAKKGDKVCVIR